MENVSFVFKNKVSIAFKISCIAMFIFGIYLIQFLLFGGIILSAFSIIILAYSEGIELDFVNKKYRNAIFLGNVPMGNWKSFPEFKYISVFRTVLTSAVVGRSGSRVSNNEKVILVNLIFGKNQQLLVFKTDDVKEAFEKAEFLSKKLNLKIYDATNKIGKMMD